MRSPFLLDGFSFFVRGILLALLRRQYAVSPANALRLNGAFQPAAMLAKLHKIVQWTKNENPSMRGGDVRKRRPMR